MRVAELYERVKKFHEKHGSEVGIKLNYTSTIAQVDADLKDIAEEALLCYREGEGPTSLRVHLIAEEFAELLNAIGDEDPVEIVDALGDLLYVVVGTAVAAGVGAEEFQEAVTRICASNDTKPAKGDPRCEDKTGYVPVDLRPCTKNLREIYKPVTKR